MKFDGLDVPLLIVSNGVVLPGASFRLPIKNRTNINTVERILARRGAGQNYIAIGYKLSQDKLSDIGTLAYVEKIFGMTFNNIVQYSIHVLGISRIRLDKISPPTCTIATLDDIADDLNHSSIEFVTETAKKLAAEHGTSNQHVASEIHHLVDEQAYGKLVDVCASLLKNVEFVPLLEFLATRNVETRMQMFRKWFTQRTIALPAPQHQTSVPTRTLRRRPHSSLDELEKKLKAIQFSDETVAERVHNELARLHQLNQSHSEYNVLLNWLELVAALPWKQHADADISDDIDVSQARQHLDDSHDAMDDVKQRVLEHLAVCKMSGSAARGMILCFSGPPGIGKTSIAKAIAASMGRRFVRVSLGGVRDESDIRGHRRTYVGAMPGRIIAALKRSPSNRPVILLDEIDKLYAGNQGSPSAALLELLDPEQNTAFHDHYLDMPFDMSNVMFIATANNLSNIEPALLDRLEVIDMSGYTLKEKLKIARNHLLPRQLSKHCVSPDYVNLDEGAIQTMVEEYTMEAGVRQLERNIAAVCRHVALRLADALNSNLDADVLPDLELPIQIDAVHVHTILKTKMMKKIRIVDRMRPLKPGVCFGLSVTSIGGRVMPIECAKMKGDGKITTTGKLGTVLTESIQVAKSWLRSNTARLSLSALDSFDVHVHLPSGSIDKDGPSAGCGIIAALVSLATDVPLRDDTAITGEISLTGNVLPIGGVKEKVLGALREGIQRVVLPNTNRDDFEQLDVDVKQQVQVVFVDTIEQVLEAMLSMSPVLAKL